MGTVSRIPLVLAPTHSAGFNEASLDGDGETAADLTAKRYFGALQRGRLSMETVSQLPPRLPRRLSGLQRGRLSMETVRLIRTKISTAITVLQRGRLSMETVRPRRTRSNGSTSTSFNEAVSRWRR